MRVAEERETIRCLSYGQMLALTAVLGRHGIKHQVKEVHEIGDVLVAQKYDVKVYEG